MHTAAILPVKRFALAKQRLDGALAPDERRALAATMVADVLDALTATASVDSIVVVTNEPSIVAAAERAGASVIADEAEAGQSPAASAGIAHARRAGAQRALLVPGDCPALAPHELEQLLASAGEREVVIVPDRHGSGTNALLLAPPDVLAPSFGVDSRARHEALAAAAGVPCTVAALPSLALDVDTGADLRALRRRLASDGDGAGAARTRAWLDRHAPAPGRQPA